MAKPPKRPNRQEVLKRQVEKGINRSKALRTRINDLIESGKYDEKLAHDINNTHSIALMLFDISRYDLERSQRMSMVENNVKRARRIMLLGEDTLRSREEYRPRRWRVDALARRISDYPKSLMLGKSYPLGTITVSNMAGDAHVYADASWLSRVVHNLVRNAEAAHNLPIGEKKDKAIHVIFTTGTNNFKIRVVDRGRGISRSNKEKIKQGISFTTKASVGGQGLGIVRDALKHHNGRLSVSDNPAGGTIMTVKIPLLK